ncbi:efflux RND transporter permease subunit [Blastopirellula sp. JC732]|uniref:Efflux RND transporter permease subunit n=1 Tax=Blastopirellula sediminis TaxID=2894196 RepID=A0A9X1MJ11_9BACT|nr:efflux RND transporter permease subunit [Blastopirellula sediminis]MCC9608037.1 efflux RND transporter permease subunit [Blastopirellula sediminis]MCC9627170.1 efflux RND transporter permease subunit [Blastopirellula sediminis]
MIRWFATNGIAANFMMLAILIAGVYVALFQIPLEVSPERSFETVVVNMTYRGGTAKDVEQAILIPIEESLEGVEGIRDIFSEGRQGTARMFIDAEPGTDLRALMDDVSARIDTITTFPDETERPQIMIPDSSNFWEVLSVAVTGHLSSHELREVARKVQEDIISLPGISRAQVQGDSKYEISVEVDTTKLLAYGLSLQDLTSAIQQFSIDLPAGSIESDSGTFIVRTRGQAYSEQEFAMVPIHASNGADILLGEVARITDGFEEGEKIVEFNGRPALFVEVLRTGKESAIDISDRVHQYVENARTRYPEGIELFIWDDESIEIRGRLTTLIESLVQGSVLVMILLGLFLRPGLAFWIVAGIPVGFAGGVMMMPYFGVTANVMSLFGFIIVVGIVVDDAIVTGENVYLKMKEGLDPLEAAVVGTHEVATPVTFGALTTMVAFIPLMFFEGSWGDFASQVPPVVAPVLLFSLIESKLILPAHLKHLRPIPHDNPFTRFQTKIADGLEYFIERVYQPLLEFSVRHRFSVLAMFVAGMFLMAGYCLSGRMEFIAYPTVEQQRISAELDMPDDTSLETTARYMTRIENALLQMRKEFVDPKTGESLVKDISKLVGAVRIHRNFDKSQGSISFEVLAPSLRSSSGPKNSDLAARWAELVGPIPEASEFRIRSDSSINRDRNVDNQNLNIELRGPMSPEKGEVARKIKSLLEEYKGFSSTWASINYGQDELELRLKPQAAELGLTQQLLAQQVRQSFFGEEAQRLQRGVDSIRVMVRLPLEQRETLHTLEQMRVRTPRGADVPLSTVANIVFTKAPSSVERKNGAEILRIGAQPIDEAIDILAIADDLSPKIQELCQENNLSFRYVGYVAEAEDAQRKTILGSALLAFVLYGMLAVALKSLGQPFFVMLAIPFAIIGALLGHIAMDITPSYLSVFGMLALAGVAVNDTLVMVDYVNQKRAEGATLHEAALQAGARRFRPIMLTSVTTFVGMLPLLMDKSLQAQFLIPMAASLAFGVMFATIVTLFLIPCAQLAADDVGKGLSAIKRWYFRPFVAENASDDHVSHTHSP